MTTTDSQKIYIWNRMYQCEEEESVYGGALVRALYGTRCGQILTDKILSKSVLSHMGGVFQSSRFSRTQIDPFIQKFKIPMEEFEPGPYPTFNDFFIRKFRPKMRSFTSVPQEMAAFAEARYYAYSAVGQDHSLPVKGVQISPLELVGREHARDFEGGPCLLARLCPVDYHRFHFPDSGKVDQTYRLHGDLHSVNPLAFQYKPNLLMTNERQVTVLHSDHFGKLAYVEVGAMCVGKIVQTSPAALGETKNFTKGEEKGYFLFGGSTVVLLGEPGRWKPDADLLQQTAVGRETKIQLGERIAISI